MKKQRHYFTNKGPSSQSYGLSSSHVWMWELNYKDLQEGCDSAAGPEAELSDTGYAGGDSPGGAEA